MLKLFVKFNEIGGMASLTFRHIILIDGDDLARQRGGRLHVEIQTKYYLVMFVHCSIS